MRKRIIKVAYKILAVILLTIFIASIPIGMFPLKDGGVYVLSDDYRLWGWPGTLVKHDMQYQSYHPLKEIKGNVICVAIGKDYLVIETDNSSWYYLQLGQPVKSYSSLKALTDDTSLIIQNHSFIQSRPWSRLEGKLMIPVSYFFVAAFLTFLFFSHSVKK